MSQMSAPISDPKLDSIVKNALQLQKWDEIKYAPLCDERTNELICLYLELVRLACNTQPVAIHKDSLEPFPVYAINRLNSLFHTNIQITFKKANTEPSTESSQ